MTGLLGILAAGAAFVSAPAAAASYVFDVLYAGNNSATLAAGSDDPLTTTLVAGDDFVYSLTAQPGFAWSTIVAADLFPFFALSLQEAGTRLIDYALVLSLDGSAVFGDVQTGATNQFAHLGTNTVRVPGSLTYDRYALAALIVQADTGSTAASLLGWPGQAPEVQFANAITYGPQSSAVPEPGMWALMIPAVGLVGGSLRLRRRTAAHVTFA